MDGAKGTLMEQPETCFVVDLGATVVMTLSRPVGRTQHHIRAPISRVLRVLRGMGWEVVEIGCDATGHLQMHLDHFVAIESGPRTASRPRTLIDAAGRLC
jgi:hypothetical protein